MAHRIKVLSDKDVAERYKLALEYYPCLLRLDNTEVAHFINTTARRLADIKCSFLEEFYKKTKK